MKTIILVGVSMVPFLMEVGCGGAVTPGPDTHPAGETGTTPIATGSTASSATVSIRGFTHSSDGAVLPGVSVCLGVWSAASAKGCTTSGSDGAFEVTGVPANSDTGVTFQKEGFLTSLRAIETQDGDVALPGSENALLPAGSSTRFLGSQVEATKGNIAFVVMGPGGGPGPEVTVTATEDDGTRVTPVYLDSQGTPSTNASQGSGGGFVNVPARAYVLRFGAPSVKCTANGLYGYPVTAFQDPTSGEAVVLVPVAAGTVTEPVAVTCTQ